MSDPTMIPAAEVIRRLSNKHRDLRDAAAKRPGRRQQLTDEARGMENAIRIVSRLVDEQTEKAS